MSIVKMPIVKNVPVRQPTKTITQQCLYRAVASSASIESTHNTLAIEAQLQSSKYAHLALSR